MSFQTLRGKEYAVSAVRRQLGLGSSAAKEGCFELLRSTVWSMATADSKAHVNRVLGTALSAWQLLSPRTNLSEEALRGELREALASLEDAGDLIELSGGYWAPAAVRLVKLPNGAGYFLVGGIPTALLLLEDGAIQFHGPHRHLATPTARIAAALPHEDLKSWAGLPELSLRDWSRTLLESLERTPYTPRTNDGFEFYLPAKCKLGTSQFFRWSESAGDTTGTLLARRLRMYGAREYRLVDVSAGEIIRACDLLDVDVRRLMYALDLQAGNPVRARLVRVRDQTEWLFTSELPRAEQRTFAAFGSLRIPDERRFERRWTFLRNEELALEMLQSIGIAFEPPLREAP